MWSSRLGTCDTGGRRFATIEDLNVNPLRCHTHGRERFGHVRHEATWPTQVDIRLAWYADFVEDRSRQMTGSIAIPTYLVACRRFAIADIAPSMRERKHEVADFARERMVLAIACGVDPQDLPRRAVRRESVEHRQNRRRTDPCAEQYHRLLSRLENETSAR